MLDKLQQKKEKAKKKLLSELKEKYGDEYTFEFKDYAPVKREDLKEGRTFRFDKSGVFHFLIIPKSEYLMKVFDTIDVVDSMVNTVLKKPVDLVKEGIIAFEKWRRVQGRIGNDKILHYSPSELADMYLEHKNK